MSLTVSPDLIEQAQRGEIDDAAFTRCIATSLPYAWQVITGLISELHASGADLADNQVPPHDEAARGQLLRVMASDAMRGAIERHFGVRLAFQNCHRAAVFRPAAKAAHHELITAAPRSSTSARNWPTADPLPQPSPDTGQAPAMIAGKDTYRGSHAPARMARQSSRQEPRDKSRSAGQLHGIPTTAEPILRVTPPSPPSPAEPARPRPRKPASSERGLAVGPGRGRPVRSALRKVTVAWKRAARSRPWYSSGAASGRAPLRAPWTGMRGSVRVGGC